MVSLDVCQLIFGNQFFKIFVDSTAEDFLISWIKNAIISNKKCTIDMNGIMLFINKNIFYSLVNIYKIFIIFNALPIKITPHESDYR